MPEFQYAPLEEAAQAAEGDKKKKKPGVRKEAEGYQNPGPMIPTGPLPTLQDLRGPAGATPLDPGPGAAGPGYVNPGAFMPTGSPLPAGVGESLTRQMMERPSAQDKGTEFQDFFRKNADRMRMDAVTSRAGPLPGMTEFTPPSGDMVHDRALGAFSALEKMAGGQEKMALEKYLGVGALGNEVTRTGLQGGHLEVGQRKQQEEERQGAYSRDRNTEALKLFQGLKLAGKTDTESLAASNLAKTIGPHGGYEAPGMRVNPQNPTGPGPLRPAGAGSAGATRPAAGGDKAAGDAEDAVTQLMKYQSGLGMGAHQKAEDLIKANKGLPEVAAALHGSLQDEGFRQRLPLIQEYLTNKFSPEEWDYFVNPTLGRQIARRGRNLVGRPSPEEVLMSMIRKEKGLGPTFGQPGESGTFDRIRESLLGYK